MGVNFSIFDILVSGRTCSGRGGVVYGVWYRVVVVVGVPGYGGMGTRYGPWWVPVVWVRAVSLAVFLPCFGCFTGFGCIFRLFYRFWLYFRLFYRVWLYFRLFLPGLLVLGCFTGFLLVLGCFAGFCWF